MSSDRAVTLADYTAAFETWATVAPLGAEERVLLASALAVLPTFLRGDDVRPVAVYCAAFDAYLSGRADRSDPAGAYCGTLRTRISKSCLLDRLLYVGEPLSATPCPLHKGKWSGLHTTHCPHGCDMACGCTSGWIPTPALLAEAAEAQAARVPAVAQKLVTIFAKRLPAGAVVGEGAGEVVVYVPARAKLKAAALPGMIEGVPVRVVRVRKLLPAAKGGAS